MPTHQPIAGVWLPLITPFKDGRLDETSLARLVRHYAAEPIDGLILAATTGEGMTLDEAETERVVAITAATRERALPMYFGLCGADTRKVAAALARTASWPIDGYLITCPYYVRPPQEGLYRHFETLAGATDKPIIVYNIPYRTGVNLANATLLRLAELPNIVGVKDCCAEQMQTFDLLRTRPQGFAVLTGEDALFYGAVAHGADGGILAAAHVETARFASVRAALVSGRREEALREWHNLVDLARLLFAEPNPAPIKHWLWRAGLIDSPEVRLPMMEVSDALAARIAAEMTRWTRGAVAA
ncbi:MAG: 4-hydroxy-tetrahydrodipicolinate synthase [Hyphomicrobiales bacterium]|nr:4-hydroxy-tetrahydrodipicolinate synthase [Hyphomicrobiales bacterium]MBV8823669.1 4-hydroxy-tetrahydrodipicolinate synthase [Hyphomicrobiales bacterium]MBV9427721.1 4-hydroxy-tetrahydrodipicolinate synthase [Bradyrhizobiaceae bacterium]